MVNQILILPTLVDVVLGIKIVGTMLISGLIILLRISALQVTRSFFKILASVGGLSVAVVILGIFFSYILNFPSGAIIVMVNFFFFVTYFTGCRFKE